MNTLLIILKIFPLILAAVQAVEQAIPLPGQGKQETGSRAGRAQVRL